MVIPQGLGHETRKADWNEEGESCYRSKNTVILHWIWVDRALPVFAAHSRLGPIGALY
jgi:hypothetical protein